MINEYFEKHEIKELAKNPKIQFFITVLFGEISELVASLEKDDLTCLRLIDGKCKEFTRFVAMQMIPPKE